MQLWSFKHIPYRQIVTSVVSDVGHRVFNTVTQTNHTLFASSGAVLLLHHWLVSTFCGFLLHSMELRFLKRSLKDRCYSEHGDSNG